MSHPFSILDVFAREKYTGNQLAVVREAADLSTAEMQAIAAEFGFSETSFVLSDTPRDGAYDVRIFTPRAEVPFAGHPTLGTAFCLHRDLASEKTDEIVLNLRAGRIAVEFIPYRNGSLLPVMKQLAPRFGENHDPATLARILGVEAGALDPDFPPRTVSTGLPVIIVPFGTLESVRAITLHRDLYFPYVEDREAKAIFVFCRQTCERENQLHARMFADAYGIPEDPATGSACGCLGAYLMEHQYLGKTEFSILIEQGYEMGRPSLLHLLTTENEEQREIYVGGKVIEVAKGELS